MNQVSVGKDYIGYKMNVEKTDRSCAPPPLIQITFVQLFCLLYLCLLFENEHGELSSSPVPAFSNGGVWFPPTEVMHASSASGHGQMFESSAEAFFPPLLLLFLPLPFFPQACFI